VRRLLAVSLLIGLLLPASAQAQNEAPCDAAKPPNLALEVPTQPAFGRSTTIKLAPTGADSRPYYSLGEHISVQAADATRPISHPVEEDVTVVSDRTSRATFITGDGPAAVNARWLERIDDELGSRYSYHYCSRTASALIAPVLGRLPSVSVRRESLGLTIVPRDAAAGESGCSLAALVPLTLEVSGAGQRGSFTVGDPCGALTSTALDSSGSFSRSGRSTGPVFRLKHDSGDITVDALGTRDAVRRFQYTVLLGTKKVASGRFWIKIDHYGGYDIYEGTDEFINICINDTHNLYSRNGRLYCHIPGGTIQTFAYRRRPS
jgi:hypothetical protein